MKEKCKQLILEYQTNDIVNKKYFNIVLKAQRLYSLKEYDLCWYVLKQIPTENELYNLLLEKLKGKRVLKTIKQISDGKVKNKYEVLKATSSLLTHAIIECENGNKQLERVFPKILETLMKIIYK
jgi:hypothetical protein